MEYKPTDSEIEVLQILWDQGPSTVRKVNEIQNEKRRVGYTTTLKIMQLMVEKNIVTVNKENRQHIYSALLEQEIIKMNLLNQFLKKTFQGSASSLVMQLLGDKNTSKKELEEIKAYINQIEKENE